MLASPTFGGQMHAGQGIDMVRQDPDCQKHRTPWPDRASHRDNVMQAVVGLDPLYPASHYTTPLDRLQESAATRLRARLSLDIPHLSPLLLGLAALFLFLQSPLLRLSRRTGCLAALAALEGLVHQRLEAGDDFFLVSQLTAL